jgi:hypothetical protein
MPTSTEYKLISCVAFEARLVLPLLILNNKSISKLLEAKVVLLVDAGIIARLAVEEVVVSVVAVENAFDTELVTDWVVVSVVELETAAVVLVVESVVLELVVVVVSVVVVYWLTMTVWFVGFKELLIGYIFKLYEPEVV